MIAFLLGHLSRHLDAVADELAKIYTAGHKVGTQEAAIKGLERTRDRLIEAIATGDDPPAGLRRKLDETESALQAARRAVRADRPQISPAALRASVRAALERLSGLEGVSDIEKRAGHVLRRVVREARVTRGSQTVNLVLFGTEDRKTLGGHALPKCSALIVAWEPPRKAA